MMALRPLDPATNGGTVAETWCARPAAASPGSGDTFSAYPGDRRLAVEIGQTLERTDVIVIGTGPTGLAAAGALALGGRQVTVIGQRATPGIADQRTAALFTGSIELLRRLGAWPELAAKATALNGIRIIDDTDAWLKAPELLFEAHEAGLREFGFNIANTDLTAGLAATIAGIPNVRMIDSAGVAKVEPSTDHVRVTLAEGGVLSAPLVAAADGRNSLSRAAAGITAETWSYPQVAITTRFRHSRPHGGISTEFHRAAGPCTVVPLPHDGTSDWSSLVWVERTAIAERYMGLDDSAFTAVLSERLHGLLGRIADVAPRRAFPLGGLSTRVLGANRIALVGEAGHVLPPIGAQGLNLGMRDAAALADCVLAANGADIGSPDVLAAYTAARKSDVGTRTTAVDLMNRSLLADLLPVNLARGFGVHLLRALPSLKRQVMAAGLQPPGNLPSLMRPT
jgi:2-octaprenyl-6-methoxyphenol hydroxylase